MLHRRHENLTILILSDEQAQELSARHAWRCLRRDLHLLARAIAKNARHYLDVYTRGHTQRTQAWTQHARLPDAKKV